MRSRSATQACAGIENLHFGYLVCSVEKQITVPLEACILFHKHDNRIVELLACDAAYLNAAALGCHVYVALLLNRRRSFEGISPHYPKALRLLRNRLSSANEAEKISDSTITVAIALALHARIMGDYDAAKHHLEGILKMTDLGGGIVRIVNRPMLAMEIFRYPPHWHDVQNWNHSQS